MTLNTAVFLQQCRPGAISSVFTSFVSGTVTVLVEEENMSTLFCKLQKVGEMKTKDGEIRLDFLENVHDNINQSAFSPNQAVVYNTIGLILHVTCDISLFVSK